MTDKSNHINDVAISLFGLEWKLTSQEKNMLQNLFFEYRSEGLDSKNALKKAVNILMCFR
jgi:hypothetical protein